MKILDLVRLILGNLSRRKARVGLTAIGVVIGTAAVVILVSLAIGLQRNANEQLFGIGDLTQIQVMPASSNDQAPRRPAAAAVRSSDWISIICCSVIQDADAPGSAPR